MLRVAVAVAVLLLAGCAQSSRSAPGQRPPGTWDGSTWDASEWQ